MAELKFYGAGCFEIKTKDATVLIDPYSKDYGKQPQLKGKIAVQTQAADIDLSDASFVIDRPGEYEISKVSINGVSVPMNIASEDSGVDKSVIYRLVIGDLSMGIIGNIKPQLADDQLEALGVVDYLIIAVGGHGLSIEPSDAAKLVATIEPKIVIPSHFADSSISYPVPQEEVSVFAKELGLEASSQSKLKLSHSNIPEKTELVVLDRVS